VYEGLEAIKLGFFLKKLDIDRLQNKAFILQLNETDSGLILLEIKLSIGILLQK